MLGTRERSALLTVMGIPTSGREGKQVPTPRESSWGQKKEGSKKNHSSRLRVPVRKGGRQMAPRQSLHEGVLGETWQKSLKNKEAVPFSLLRLLTQRHLLGWPKAVGPERAKCELSGLLVSTQQVTGRWQVLVGGPCWFQGQKSSHDGNFRLPMRSYWMHNEEMGRSRFSAVFLP